jgi:hypothetical protein
MASNNPQWEGKPHLVLNWLFDIPNQTLTCCIGDDLEYIAHQGGLKGYTKRRRNADGTWKETHVDPLRWQGKEKQWISENYGELVGYFQEDYDRMLVHPTDPRPEQSPNGVGPDGRYLDHMQRMQILLEGEDMALIGFGTSHTAYVTPNCGKTIYKRVPTRNVDYPAIRENPDDESLWWPEHPQPCMMQPYSPGVKLSSYDEMINDNIDAYFVQRCKEHRFDCPKHPELQQWYIYPTE